MKKAMGERRQTLKEVKEVLMRCSKRQKTPCEVKREDVIP